MELQLGKPSLDNAKIQKLFDDPYKYPSLTQAKLGSLMCSSCILKSFLVSEMIVC